MCLWSDDGKGCRCNAKNEGSPGPVGMGQSGRAYKSRRVVQTRIRMQKGRMIRKKSRVLRARNVVRQQAPVDFHSGARHPHGTAKEKDTLFTSQRHISKPCLRPILRAAGNTRNRVLRRYTLNGVRWVHLGFLVKLVCQRKKEHHLQPLVEREPSHTDADALWNNVDEGHLHLFLVRRGSDAEDDGRRRCHRARSLL